MEDVSRACLVFYVLCNLTTGGAAMIFTGPRVFHSPGVSEKLFRANNFNAQAG